MFYGIIGEQLYSMENYSNYVYQGSNTPLNEQSCIDILTEGIDKDEGFGTKLRPIYVILLYSDSRFDHVMEKFVKNQQYWHAAISFGPALSTCYSFNYGEADANKFKGGLSFESIKFYKEEHPTGTMQVGVLFVTPEKYKKVKEALSFYIHNKEKTKYSFINLLYSWLGKPTKNGLKLNLVCSTFVDTLLKHANININNKQTNLVKPDDLKYTNDKSYFKVYEGKIKDYKEDPVIKKSEELGNRVRNDFFRHEKDEKVEDITDKKKDKDKK
jgi:hypothetical protein